MLPDCGGAHAYCTAEMNTSGKVWEDSEIELIVADYLDMLQLELGGVKFNKAGRNRILQQRLGRTKGSIEYKHQNISAVLDILGLPRIRGYMPAVNYQARLFEIVEAHLVGNSLLTRLSDQPGDVAVPGAGIEFQAPPQRREKPKEVAPAIRRILHRFDPAARDARARRLGEAGERYLFHAEQNRLSSIGRDDLAGKVRWVSKEDGDGAGYDILSFSALGETRWLEVKTTNGPITTPFWITRNELRASEENPAHYYLARLYDFSRAPAAYRLTPPLSDHVHLSTTQYLASF